jgi:hypothetical protein
MATMGTATSKDRSVPRHRTAGPSVRAIRMRPSSADLLMIKEINTIAPNIATHPMSMTLMIGWVTPVDQLCPGLTSLVQEADA